MKSLSLRLMALTTLMLFLGSLVACTGSRGGGDDDDAADDDDAVGDDDDDDDDDDATDDDDAAGGPETLSLCGDVGAGSIPVAGTVVIPDPDLGLLFDMYTIDALAGDCIWVRGDNGSEGADLLAFVADSAQNYYGMAQDFSQLDDDWDCTTANADGYGCPDASVTVIADGPVMIGISMFNNEAENMTAADYTLNVAVNGTDVDPGAPVQDDQPLP